MENFCLRFEAEPEIKMASENIVSWLYALSWPPMLLRYVLAFPSHYNYKALQKHCKSGEKV